MHAQTKLTANSLDVPQTLLVVRTSASHPDLHLVLNQQRRNLSQRTNDTLECRRNVREVSNTTTNEEDLALWPLWRPQHQIKDCARIVEGLRLSWRTRVLAVVCELGCETGRGDGIGVHDGGTTTSDESPDAALRVEDCELEGGTSLCVHLGDVCFLLAEFTAEGGWELHRWAGIDADLA